MPKLPLTVLISFGAHLVLVTGAVAYKAANPGNTAEARISTIELLMPSRPAEPVAVLSLPEINKLVATATPEPSHNPMGSEDRKDRVVRAIASRPAVPTVLTARNDETRAGNPVNPINPVNPVNPMFSMRGQRRIDLSLPKTSHDALEHAPAGTTPQVDVPQTGRLAPSGNGTYRSKEGVFTGNVARDGSVKLKDARNFQIKSPFKAGFDITDAFMRRHKIDPYASRKLAYLDATRDERVQIGNRYRKEQLSRSNELMQNNLAMLWGSTTDLAKRKQGLFELWDECAETGEASVIEGGTAARLLVVAWISSKLPSGGALAFTASELATFNRKRSSKRPFEPYARESRPAETAPVAQ